MNKSIPFINNLAKFLSLPFIKETIVRHAVYTVPVLYLYIVAIHLALQRYTVAYNILCI